MTQWKLRSGRKKTGGLLKRHGKKKKYQRGRDFLPARVGQRRVKENRTRGGSFKRILIASDTANVVAENKMQKARIISVKKNPADSQYERRNIITKGATIETELGLAVVTSRPGQHGTINAVLLPPVEAKEHAAKKK